MTDEQLEKLTDAIRSVGRNAWLAGFLIYVGIMFNGCMHK